MNEQPGTTMRQRSRLWLAFRPRASRSQLVVALLCALLGFGLATQVHAQRGDTLTTARESDLVGILDNLTARADRLRGEIGEQQGTLSKLSSGSGRTQAALDDARQRAATLAILAGTSPATGPGIELTVFDPDRVVKADVLLNAVEELRDAGAEAIEIDGNNGVRVRIVASSYFTDDATAIDGSGGSGHVTVRADGVLLEPPYTLRVIGGSHTLATAMQIPGGVVETIRSKGASVSIVESQRVDISALHAVTSPTVARPAPSPAS